MEEEPRLNLALMFRVLSSWLELQTNVCEDFTITEMAPTRAFSWLKADVKLERQLIDHNHN